MPLGPFVRRRSTPPEPPDEPAATGPEDLEREELRLATAVLNGEVPPIWYRQRMTALAAQRETADRTAEPPA